MLIQYKGTRKRRNKNLSWRFQVYVTGRIVIPAIVVETGKQRRFGKAHGKLSYGMEHLGNV